jgi:hypothetical protein
MASRSVRRDDQLHAFGTPFIERFNASARPTAGQTVAGLLAWTFALTAPAGLFIIGSVRLAGALERMSGRGSGRAHASRFAADLGNDYTVASHVRLPDGRLVGEVVIGPFGAAVIDSVPPAGASRQHDGRWEVRLRNGSWLPLENPLAKAVRDAERVRRWLGHENQGFLVKVYAAVIAPETRLARTSNCAVVDEAQLGAWLASLPAQRGLTASRRDSLVAMLREAV